MVATSLSDKLKELLDRVDGFLHSFDPGLLAMFADPAQVEELKDDLNEFRALIQKQATEVDDAIEDLVEDQARRLRFFWELEVPSDSDPAKSYQVRYDIVNVRHHDEDEDASTLLDPDYSCTCMSYITQNMKTPPYCKHIRDVIARHGASGEMPPKAVVTGRG